MNLTNESKCLPLQLFTIKDNELIACESDFGSFSQGQWWLHQLYSDAADLGIAIRSHKTNEIVRFYLSEENERFMKFKVVSEDAKRTKIPNVILFND